MPRLNHAILLPTLASLFSRSLAPWRLSPRWRGAARWHRLMRLMPVLALLWLGSGTAQAALERVSDFAALDTRGEFIS